MTDVPAVYVIHENPQWFAPIAEAFADAGVPVREWLVSEGGAGSLDLSAPPPNGVFWSRISASAHLRQHPHAKEYGRAILEWLDGSGRRVVNGRRVLELEVSKVAQHAALSRFGLDVPRTAAVFGRQGLAKAARTFAAPFILKHNQGGTGLSVRRFDSHGELEYYIASMEDFEEPTDGITLLQEYLVAAQPHITRAEFVGGKFLYAVQVDTSAGSFELCPASDSRSRDEASVTPFSLRHDLDQHPVIAQYERFLRATGIEIAGIEFIETEDGRLVTYDVNTNTNYNPGIEAESARSGAQAAAVFFAGLLDSADMHVSVRV